MGRGGLEHTADSPSNLHISHAGGIKSGNTQSTHPSATQTKAPTDPGLDAVVAAWPSLPPAIRAGVLALVKASHT